ncbi:MAG: hypothetical protein LJE60_11705, partial [Thiocapsa sp.]
MPESIAWTAFWMGILSACSLPLGALTTRFWTPGDRTTAMLMAFGGGALLAALFLSNYPEALSSSIGMRQQGMSFARIMMMWSLLMLITGAGAAAGSQLFVGADPAIFALMQGLAAGAMLTMIAETMLPEAYLKGGSGV